MQHTATTTADGSSTLQLTQFGETYHSRNGAYTEATHIYIKNGLEHLFAQIGSRAVNRPCRINIFDVGFGTALNCILSYVWQQQLRQRGLPYPCIAYYGVEKYPIPLPEIEQLNYPGTIAEHTGFLPIMLGQVISYYIYIWNLNQKGIMARLHFLGKLVLVATPLLAFWSIATNWSEFVQQCFRNEDIPMYLLVYGSLGQIIFTLRFVYQYFYSKKKNESMLPAGFWIISLTGSAIIVSYGIFRLDPVIILGQSFGFVSYIRNLIISHRSKKTEKE